jgi:hypothetical protein
MVVVQQQPAVVKTTTMKTVTISRGNREDSDDNNFDKFF